MGVEKFRRPVVAPSFTPETGGISLSDLAQGTDGQVPIAATSAATAYHALSGDVTMTNAGVTTIGANKVTAAKVKLFYSASVTGTGSPQNIAHGLGVVPTVVITPFTGTTALQAITYGTHTTTNIVLTCTLGATFAVFAV